MDDLSATDINRNMSGIANQITGLRICQTSYVITDITIGSGGMRQGYAEILINAHNKTGAVRTVCQTCPTVYIGITDKLYRIVCNGLSQASNQKMKQSPAEKQWIRKKYSYPLSRHSSLPLLFPSLSCALPLPARLSLRLLLPFLLRQFWLSLLRWILRSHTLLQLRHNPRNPAVTFLNADFDETVFFIQNGKFFASWNQTNNARFQARIASDLQGLGVDSRHLLTDFICDLFRLVSGLEILRLHITFYAAGFYLIPVAVLCNQRADRIVIQLTDDFAIRAGGAADIYIIVDLRDDQNVLFLFTLFIGDLRLRLFLIPALPLR